jgi:GTP-binding protein EngB required for normal cell division
MSYIFLFVINVRGRIRRRVVKANKIEIGKTYRLIDSPDYGYVKPIEIIRPGTWQMKALAEKEGIKPFGFIVVRCEHTVGKNDTVGLIRYFRPVSIVACSEEAGL